ncbi:MULTISPECIES: type II toxin-antitoxin system death-on-curing family toxin [unclassified Ruminococcus]|uniref:type II toxin-antitoxin system death-on-curing family toxin n=1 Tax=unclassified Ruminococcus TaxID=2608920 RepID=UPI0021099B37|nr:MULTISPECIES: type II toxin-antitoxin system death-on-curing family toxin [unclassified Ruminococcus]MCQ4021806.1 type II toxin-antitoxin system death-on-curing family toxin [Ruminococcus sp. zg-924]MCQ4114251.1 type II toxin-antitoxin system death-on-curing family toxin [Ruminococcus sp. zg-921]
MIILSKSQIITMHKSLLEETGGLDGIREEGLLDSAINAPFQKFDNTDLFPSIQQKAARLGYGIIKNHAFIDGNKRIGTHTMLVFLALNGIELDYTQKELYTTILNLAGGKLELDDLTKWIIEHQN